MNPGDVVMEEFVPENHCFFLNKHSQFGILQTYMYITGVDVRTRGY